MCTLSGNLKTCTVINKANFISSCTYTRIKCKYLIVMHKLLMMGFGTGFSSFDGRNGATISGHKASFSLGTMGLELVLS